MRRIVLIPSTELKGGWTVTQNSRGRYGDEKWVDVYAV
jgi:hypothetical protein